MIVLSTKFYLFQTITHVDFKDQEYPRPYSNDHNT
jgi:hypothetical protein